MGKAKRYHGGTLCAGLLRMAKAPELLAKAPVIEKVEVLAAKLPN
jgi:hypothetical protein